MVYHAQIYDLVRKKLLVSFEGRKYENVKAFFEEWGIDNLKNTKGICCDMWDTYLKAIKEFLSDAAIVFDKFHIIRHFLNAVSDVRKHFFHIHALTNCR